MSHHRYMIMPCRFAIRSKKATFALCRAVTLPYSPIKYHPHSDHEIFLLGR